MSAARHFTQPGTLSATELRGQITADIAAARLAQRDATVSGQRRIAADMADAVDEGLDELNAANAGTWQPEHA